MKTDKMRCHFSIILEKTAGFLAFWIILAFQNIHDIISAIDTPGLNPELLKDLLPATLGVLAILLVIMGYQFMIWRKTFIYLDDTTIVVERNTINRRKNTFGIASIANINLEQNLFQRLMHTYRLKLDTDSYSTANETDISIVLSETKAKAFQAQVLSLMNQNLDRKTNDFQESASNIPYASAKEVFLHCLHSIPSGFFITALFFLVGIPLLFYFCKLSPSDLLSEEGTSFSGQILGILLLIIGYLYQILKQLLSYYHFTSFRRGNELVIRYGFFRKQDFTIPVERINALRIIQQPIARITNRFEAQLICIGMGDDEKEKAQLTLCLKKNAFCQQLQELLPEFSTKALDDLRGLPKGSAIVCALSTLFRGLIFSLAFFFVFFLTAEFLPAPFAVFILLGIILAVIFLYGLLHYFCLGFHLDSQQLTLAHGALKKQISLIPFRKIQFFTFEQNPTCRIFQVFRGSVFILASLGSNILPLPYLDIAQVNALKKIL